jgi:hypothetical protein
MNNFKRNIFKIAIDNIIPTFVCNNFTLNGGSGAGNTFTFTNCDGTAGELIVPTGDSVDVCIRLPFFHVDAVNNGDCTP